MDIEYENLRTELFTCSLHNLLKISKNFMIQITYKIWASTLRLISVAGVNNACPHSDRREQVPS